MLHWPPESTEVAAKLKDIFLKHSSRHVIAKNGVVYLQEDKADKLYIVLSGYVRLSYIMEDGTSILYAILPPGQSFGELGVLDGSVYMDTASAVGQVSVLAVRSDIFHSNSPEASQVRGALGELVAERYKDYIDVTRCLYMSSLTSRLAMSLVRLARNLGKSIEIQGNSYLYIGSMVTQSDLGTIARGTRGNVNRVLKKWERDGLIIMKDRKIILRNPHGLEQAAKDV